ncbi:MAG: SLC13 family permease [Leptolyngbya sp. SIO4C1]|nr:SLC13 family permease [Leptolyngbya sp. SIO4C1]
MTVALTLSIVIFALVCFVCEWFPADITAIMIMVILMTLGLVTPEEGISGFSNTATITVLAMFILSAGIARTGVVELISTYLNRWGSRSASQQIFTMGAIVAPISGFINNTAVVAVFLPVIEDWCRRQKISPSKLLLPLSYITVLGGMITVIGTSTNVLASGLSEQLGYEPFSLFQFTRLGVITCSVGLLYLALVAPRWLPERRSAQQSQMLQSYGLKDYVSEIVIPPGSRLIGQTLQSSQLQRQFDLDVLELIRGESRFSQPLADKLLQAGDILLVRAPQPCLLQIQAEKSVKILPAVQFGATPPDQKVISEAEGLAEVLLLPTASIVGSTLKETRFRQRYNATVLAIRRGESVMLDRLGKMPLRFGDTLLVQGPKQSLLGLQTNAGLLVTEQPPIEILRRDKAWIAIAIMLGVIIVAAFEWLPILVSAWVGVVLMLLTGCLRPGELYAAVRWDVIFLLAGLIPLGVAMENSGATQWLADSLVTLAGQLPAYWILTLLFVITSLITEILSNNACVVLLLPVAVKLAEALSLNPYALMLVVTFAASNSFMTPIGYQTNTMVYGPGGYRFSDFLRIGTPLNLIMAVITPPLIIWLYGL